MLTITVKNPKYDFQFVTSAVALVWLLFELANDALLQSSSIDQVPAWLMLMALISFIYILCRKNQTALLYLQLEHDNNQIVLSDIEGKSTIFEINRNSKANQFGVWLYLSTSNSVGRERKNMRLFIGKWQTSQRSFRALHRHLNWYVHQS